MNFPRVHPREKIVKKAALEFLELKIKWLEKDGLTLGEILQILSSEVSDVAKWTIRQERHPENEDKPGRLE